MVAVLAFFGVQGGVLLALLIDIARIKAKMRHDAHPPEHWMSFHGSRSQGIGVSRF